MLSMWGLLFQFDWMYGIHFLRRKQFLLYFYSKHKFRLSFYLKWNRKHMENTKFLLFNKKMIDINKMDFVVCSDVALYFIKFLEI